MLDKIEREPVIATPQSHRRERSSPVSRACIARHGADGFASVSGHPAWSFLNLRGAPPYSVWQVRTLYLQEMFARGILCLGTHNMSYAHSDDDVAKLLGAYDEVLPLLRDTIATRTLESRLRCEALVPLFRVR